MVTHGWVIARPSHAADPTAGSAVIGKFARGFCRHHCHQSRWVVSSLEQRIFIFLKCHVREKLGLSCDYITPFFICIFLYNLKSSLD
jgi:hypothetical protein